MINKNKKLINSRDYVSTHSQYTTYSVTCHTVHIVHWFLNMCLEYLFISFIYSTSASTFVIEIIMIINFITTPFSLCISVDKGCSTVIVFVCVGLSICLSICVCYNLILVIMLSG